MKIISFSDMMEFTAAIVIIGRARCPPHRSFGLFLEVFLKNGIYSSYCHNWAGRMPTPQEFWTILDVKINQEAKT
ncbi:MAG: hypothetical protein ACK6A9_16430 [Dolichospermum sp.]|jgi:hypothetical protein